MPDGKRKVTGGFTAFGAIGLLVALPPLVVYLWLCLRYNGGAFIVPRDMKSFVGMLQLVPAPTWTATAIYLGWFCYHALMQQYAPGRWAEGTPLPDGTRLKYKLNGWFTWWFTWAAL